MRGVGRLGGVLIPHKTLYKHVFLSGFDMEIIFGLNSLLYFIMIIIFTWLVVYNIQFVLLYRLAPMSTHICQDN